MKHIEITTSNHVGIEYELSSSWQRLIAFFIDGIIIFIWYLLSSFFAEAMFSNNLDNSTSTVVVVLFQLPAMFYSLICEAFFKGQSIGKAVIGIKVVKMDGTNPSIGEATIRWSFRFIDIWFSAGAFAMLLISGSERSQRIGDSLANTIVINKKPKELYSINDILALKDVRKYTPSFPAVIQFTDDDMLLIKNALDRADKYPSDRHDDLLSELRSQITERLALGKIKANNHKFLKKVLQDYIVLTRS